MLAGRIPRPFLTINSLHHGSVRFDKVRAGPGPPLPRYTSSKNGKLQDYT